MPPGLFGGLDEAFFHALEAAGDPRWDEGDRREAAGYARGLEQAIYVLTGHVPGRWCPCSDWGGGGVSAGPASP